MVSTQPVPNINVKGRKPRLLLAGFKHETNTFSPVPTPYSRFFLTSDGPITGQTAVRALRGTGTTMGGFIAVAEREGAEIVLPVYAIAKPSGPVDSDAFERITQMILDAAVDKALDGVLLDLHGAMVAEGFEDGEGELLRRLRALQPDIPIGVTLDMHANLYPDMIARVTILNGFHTYPHTDMYDAGQRCAELLIQTIQGTIKPTIAWGNRPMMPHIMRQGTHADPNKSLQEECIALETSRTVLAASVFTGFPHANIHHVGLSAVVCTDEDFSKAESVCERMLDKAWQMRGGFLYAPSPLEQAVSKAKRSTADKVILLDHCDNTGSGGTMDTTRVLEEVLRQGLDRAVFYAIYDPEAVELAINAGVGALVKVSLGGKTNPLPSTGDANPPLTVTARVRTISDGEFKFHGPMMAGTLAPKGKAVVLEVDGVLIAVISAHIEPYDRNCILSLGIDLSYAKYIILKSRVHWRAGFGHLPAEVIECDSIGVTTSDYSKLNFDRVRRPIFPLDNI